MGQKKKRTKRRKPSGTPRNPDAKRTRKLNIMTMGCLVILLVLAGFLVLPRLLSGSS